MATVHFVTSNDRCNILDYWNIFCFVKKKHLTLLFKKASKYKGSNA